MQLKKGSLCLCAILVSCAPTNPGKAPSPTPTSSPVQGNLEEIAGVEKFACRIVQPACTPIVSGAGGGLDATGYSLDNQIEYHINIVQKYQQPDASQPIFTGYDVMDITLKDLPSGESMNETYTIQNNETLTGGVEGFVGSNGLKYGVDCIVSRFPDSQTPTPIDELCSVSK